MRVIRFPAEEPRPGKEPWVAELEAALCGGARGPAADAWRELREDVCSLAPAMTPAFAAHLERELERRGALPRAPIVADAPGRPTDPDTDRASSSAAGEARRAPRGALARLGRGARTLASHRRASVGAAMTAAVALVAAILVAGPGGSGRSVESVAPPRNAPAVGASPGSSAARSSLAAGATPSKSVAPTASSQATGSEAPSASPLTAASAPAAAAAPGRVQQLAASVTLGTTAANVQTVSDQVGQLAVRAGGYVQSSNVQIRSQGAGEATLSLKLPSARLGAALAAIDRLAAVRAENQSLQDITNSYNSKRQQLGDAVAERRALLRALAAATSEGQIDSLRERLAEARSAIVRAQNAFDAVSRRAATAEVEVSIIGDTHAGTAGLTVHRGLHDAGHVLLVTLTAILIVGAILVPLALLAAAIAGARRALRRYRRERVLKLG